MNGLPARENNSEVSAIGPTHDSSMGSSLGEYGRSARVAHPALALQ